MSATLIIDCFAGGGGASTGIEMALGRSPDYAINHDPVAVAMHAVNHPGAVHLCQNVYQVDPLDHFNRAHIGFAWFSPDCKHFSKAKGGAPVQRNIRDLAWIIPGWIERIQKSGGKVDVVAIENVEEFQTWGPLLITDKGLMPDPDRKGETFKLWCRKLRSLGGRIEWRELRACDYGAPTIRKRVFILIRFDGQKIVWPEPTHGDPKSEAVKTGKLLPWLTAGHDVIDWSIVCPSIFDSKAEIMLKHNLRAVRPLADATQARVARGIKRYVLDAARPFLVNLTHGAQQGVVAASMLSMKGSARRASSADEPARVACTGGGQSAVVAGALTKYYGTGDGQQPCDPLHTVTTKDRFCLSQAALAAPPFGPEHHGRAREVAAFLRLHGFWDEREFVTLDVEGVTLVMVDIGMRMLTPRELFNAQGFPADYEIDRDLDGNVFSKSDQVGRAGNSVCPPLAEAIARANVPHLALYREAAE